jgi:hypothetical protein
MDPNLETLLKTPFGRLLMHTIQQVLPARMDDTDLLQAAFEAFAAFGARTPVEQMLAAQAVAAHFAAMDCYRQAIAPDADPRTADRARGKAAAMARTMRDTMKLLDRRQKPPESETVSPPPPPLPFIQREVSPDAPPATDPDGTPRMPDFREKPLNGDPMRDFLSRRFDPSEDVEGAWEEAKKGSAALEAAEA